MPKVDLANLLAGVGRGIGSVAEAHMEKSKMKIQQNKVDQANSILSNPESTPIQKAQALANIGQEKLGLEVFKSAADDSALSGIFERLNRKRGVTTSAEQMPEENAAEIKPTQSSSSPHPMMINYSQGNTAQPAAEGTGSSTQPGFSVNGPQSASRNQTALNKPTPILNQTALENVSTTPQENEPVDPETAASAFEEAALEAAAIGKHPIAKQLANKAKEIKKDVRLDKKFKHDIEREIIKDETDLRKETAPYIEGVVNAYKGKKNQEAILNQMEHLASDKELTTPLMHSLLGAAGLPLGVLNNPDSEEFEKLSNSLTRDITKFYGARINQTEFINFLKQIPSLSNSEEGRLRVTRNLKRMLEPVELEYKIMSQMLAENGGKPFPNMNFHVTQKMEPILDKWASEINDDMKDVKDMSTPLGADEVSMKFTNPDGSTVRKRVPKSEVGKWLQWGVLE